MSLEDETRVDFLIKQTYKKISPNHPDIKASNKIANELTTKLINKGS